MRPLSEMPPPWSHAGCDWVLAQERAQNKHLIIPNPIPKETKVDEKMFTKASKQVALLEEKLDSMVRALDNTTAELSREKKKNTTGRDERALYVNCDGSIRNASPISDGNGPLREVHVEEFTTPNAYDVRRPGLESYPFHRRRTYRLVFSQGRLHVYQEIG